MKAPRKKPRAKKYVTAALIGFFLGFANFVVFYALLSGCSFNGFLSGVPFIVFFLIDIPVVILTQMFVIKGDAKFNLPIAIAFFFLGVSPAAAINPTCPENYCVPRPYLNCYSVSISTTGNLSISYSKTSAGTFYNVGMACAATYITFLVPNPTKSMVYLSANGSATSSPANGPGTGALSLSAGQTINVTNLKCWTAQGFALNKTIMASNTIFEGTLWMNYTASPGAPSPQNPMQSIHLIDVGASAQFTH